MDFIYNNLRFLIIGIIVVTIFTAFIFTKKRHHYKIKQGERVLKKIRSFEGVNRDERVINYLRQINPFTFEEMLLTLFEESGCKIKRNKKYTGDGGIDGKFKHKGHWYYIQAKRYSNHIKNTDVQTFVNLCLDNKVRGLFIHTGKAGKMSYKALDNQSAVMIIDPKDLVNFIMTGKLKINEN